MPAVAVIAPTPAPARPAPSAPSPKPDPKSASVHNLRGRDLMNSGKLREAVDELTLAIAADPTLAMAYNARGFAYYLQRDFAHALADYEKAIQLMPGYPNAIHNRELAEKAANQHK